MKQDCDLSTSDKNVRCFKDQFCFCIFIGLLMMLGEKMILAIA